MLGVKRFKVAYTFLCMTTGVAAYIPGSAAEGSIRGSWWVRGQLCLCNSTTSEHIGVGVLFGARLALGAVFIYSALAKIRRPYDFLENVYEFELLGPRTGALVAAFVPWFELVLGICLLTGIAVSAALLGVLVLSALFVAFQLHAIRGGLSIACGCFGSSDPVAQPVDYRTVLRAILIFTAAGAAFPVSIGVQQLTAKRGKSQTGITKLTRLQNE